MEGGVNKAVKIIQILKKNNQKKYYWLHLINRQVAEL